MESSQRGNRTHLFCRKVSFLTAPHCQFRGVGQSMKQTYLYLCYPLFQAQWDMQSTKSPNLELFSEKDIIYIAEREIKGSG